MTTEQFVEEFRALLLADDECVVMMDRLKLRIQVPLTDTEIDTCCPITYVIWKKNKIYCPIYEAIHKGQLYLQLEEEDTRRIIEAADLMMDDLLMGFGRNAGKCNRAIEIKNKFTEIINEKRNSVS